MAYDFQSGAGGAVSGAATGFAIGGPWGALGGGVLGSLSGFGKKKKKATSTLDKRQKRLYQDQNEALYGRGPLSDIYNFDTEQANNVFDQSTARPAYRQWQENIIPQITGQFRQGNLMNSSYSGEALARSGRDVQEGLNAKRAEMNFLGSQKALDRRAEGLNNVMGTNTQAIDRNQSPSVIDQLLNSLSGPAGDFLADYFKKSSGTSQPSQPSRGGATGYSMDIMNQFTGGMQ